MQRYAGDIDEWYQNDNESDIYGVLELIPQAGIMQTIKAWFFYEPYPDNI